MIHEILTVETEYQNCDHIMLWFHILAEFFGKG